MKKLLIFLTTSAFLLATDGCSPKQEDKDDSTKIPATVEYEVSEEKTNLAKYHELDFIKEWYPERVLPPVFDYDIDLTQKSPVELWLLRNEIFARNGYLFDDATLRGYFNQFKWYQPIFDVPEFKVQLNEKEQEFVNRVLKREKELASSVITKQGTYDMIDWNHVYNQVQFKQIDPNLQSILSKNNFAIVPARDVQLFHTYDRNHYGYIPNFITTDLYLQVLHKHLSATLKNVEDGKLIDLVAALLQRMYAQSQQVSDPRARWSSTYLGIAYSLMTNKLQSGKDIMLQQEFTKLQSADGNGSEFLQDPYFNYSTFLARGNYTESEELTNYFRCIKWLNTAGMNIGTDEGLMSVVYMAAWIKGSPDNLRDFSRFNNALQLIVGEEDNASLQQIVDLMSNEEAADPTLAFTPERLRELRESIRSSSKDRIKPNAGDAITAAELSQLKVLFSAGRYTFDSEILNRLVHVLHPQPKRTFPKGLDIFAALGVETAKGILIDEFMEQKKWPGYSDSLAAVARDIKGFTEWDRNLYTKTFETIQAINEGAVAEPLFTKTPAWAKRNLSTALAAWTQLRHDMLLYVEQPYIAQAGEGGGPPPPAHVSYVEPNIFFWTKVLELLDFEQTNLQKLDLLDPDTKGVIDQLREIGTLLLNVSKKQLAHEPVTKDEFEDLSYIGGQIEYLTFQILGTNHLPEKEKMISEVVDVYRYNSQFLEEGVGLVDEIYVIVEINDKPHITKGAVFSYYEFQSPSPMTDQEWRFNLNNQKAPPRPTWLKEIMVEAQSLESKPSYRF